MRAFNLVFLAVFILFNTKSVFADELKRESICSRDSLQVLSDESIRIRDYVRKDTVIAHRGSTYWTPEETEASYRWARNIGADYLEPDYK